jgi:hypothetical protein
LWFSFNFDISIIIFIISSGLGSPLLVVVAAEVVDVLLLDCVEPPAGLSLGIDGEPGETLGNCANAEPETTAAARGIIMN